MSPIDELLRPLLALPPAERMAALDAALDACLPSELVALVADFRGTWARPEQVLPDGTWRSFGLQTGRGWGKTATLINYAVTEMLAGRAMRVALVSQSEAKTIEILVTGETGILAMAPAEAGATWEPSTLQVHFRNGAMAQVYTANEPDGLRGPQHHLGIADEIAYWPRATGDATFANLRLGLRLGYGRLLWASSPRRKHPLVRTLRERAAREPGKHILIAERPTAENEINLSPDVVAEWRAMWGGTQRGQEELEGIYLDDDEGALWRQDWIDRARRDMPMALARRILSVDPAISDRKGTDATGIVDLGLGDDGQVFVIANLTARHAWERWGQLLVSRYMATRCDCIVVERNRGGSGPTANIRAAARDLGIRVEVLEARAPTRHTPAIIYVKEINSQQSKGARAAPVAHEYERGRVSHVHGGEGLEELEDVLTTWAPEMQGQSPDALDAMVHGVWELARLADSKPDNRHALRGIEKAQATLRAPVAAPRVDGEITGARAALGMLAPSEWGTKI